MEPLMNELNKFVTDYYSRDHIPFIEYFGEGKLVLKDRNELNCKFIAKQFTDGETLLICHILPISIHRISIERWKNDLVWGNSFIGQTMDGKFFEAIEINNGRSLIQDDPLIVCAVFVPREFRVGMIDNVSFDSISFGITNFLFKGIPYKTENYTEYIDFNLAGKCSSIWKNKDYDNISMFMKSRNRQHITCELWADISDLDEIEEMKNKVKDLCYILSVGSGSKIQWIFENIWAKGSLVYARHLLVPNKPYNSQTIIDAEKHIDDWGKFINIAVPRYPTYINLFGEIKGLPRIMAAIDVFTDARILIDFTQTKGIKLATTMEVIKEMFRAAWIPETKMLKGRNAKNMERDIKKKIEPILKGYLPEEEANSILGTIYELNKVPFETILRKGFEMIKFEPKSRDLELFIRNRNSLVHQGRFYSETATDDQKVKCSPLESAEEDYIFTSNFLAEVFLALFGYKGRHGELYIIE